MAIFFMLGKYSLEAVKGISPDRTKEAINLIEKLGGKVNSIYALLGKYDLVFIVELPGMQEIIKASIELNRLTGISFCTLPAITVEEFDKIIID